jgi:hypothetical protein
MRAARRAGTPASEQSHHEERERGDREDSRINGIQSGPYSSPQIVETILLDTAGSKEFLQGRNRLKETPTSIALICRPA